LRAGMRAAWTDTPLVERTAGGSAENLVVSLADTTAGCSVATRAGRLAEPMVVC